MARKKYRMKIRIKLPIYLQYYVKYNLMKGEAECVGKNKFNNLIRSFLSVRPKDENYIPTPLKADEFEFVLPHLRCKDPSYFHYISEKDNETLIAMLETMFYQSLFSFIDDTAKVDYEADYSMRIRSGERIKAYKKWLYYRRIPEYVVNEYTVFRAYNRHLAANKKLIAGGKQTELKF